MDNNFLKSISRGFATLVVLVLLTSSLPSLAISVRAAPGATTRVSVDSSGVQANNYSRFPSISGDGRFVAFESEASNLVPADTNGTGDVFIHDLQSGATTRVSVDSSGIEANDSSGGASISSDGRFVAFYSYASNLVAGDTNGMIDIFVHDRQMGATTRVSVDSSGVEANGNAADVYYAVSISGDGRYVAFQSEASNLVSSDTNGNDDIFVHDRQAGVTTRVSVDSSGAQANASSSAPVISDDGNYIVFSSGATNLVTGDTNSKTDVFVHDRQTGATTLASVNSSGVQADGGGSSPSISGNGRYVVFLSDSNNLAAGTEDFEKLVYVRDRQAGQTTLASVYTDGNLMYGTLDQPTISGNGRYVAFSFYERGNGQGLQDIWMRDLQTGETLQVTQGGTSSEDSSYSPSLSADGETVAFWSASRTLVSGDTNGFWDIFVYELPIAPKANPNVVSVTPFGGVTSASRMFFQVTFTESVTGVTTDDFLLTTNGNISNASIVSVGGSGNLYSVEVDTGTGDGQLRLDVVDDDSIVDDAFNPLGGVGAGNGNFTSEGWTTIDKTAPVVTGSLRADPNPTAAEIVRYTVTFSEVVYQVDVSDFVLTTTGGVTGASVTDVSGADNTFTVTVNTGNGDGTLRLDVIDIDEIGTIRDAASNPIGGPGPDNGNFTTGEVYTINKGAQGVPSVISSLRVDPNPTLADLVSFTVTFSEDVSGVDPDDFSVTTTGNITGAFVTNASGSGNTYNVIVATGNGDGSLRLDVTDNDSIQNSSGVSLGGTGTGNGNFTTGEAYMVDKNVPYVTGSLRADANLTTAASVAFTVGFSEAVSGVDVSDFFVSTTGNIPRAAITGVSGSGNLYSVSVSTGEGNGTLRLEVLDNDSIIDASGYPLGGPGIGNGNFTAGEEYTINRKPVELITETYRSNGKNDGWVLESSEDSEQGGFKDSTNTTFVLGDNAQNSQFRSILHFPTFYIPDNAVITRALIMIKAEAVAGTDPFTTHGNILVDIRSGAFGFIGPFPYRGLQVSDFQSPAHRDAVAVIENNQFNGWYWAWLDSSAFEYINLNGITQLRLRFQIADDDDFGNDYMRFFSGDYDDLALRPRLVIEYYVP